MLRGGQGATGTAVRSRAAKPIPLSDENAEDESVDDTAEDDSDEAEDKEETTDIDLSVPEGVALDDPVDVLEGNWPGSSAYG